MIAARTSPVARPQRIDVLDRAVDPVGRGLATAPRSAGRSAASTSATLVFLLVVGLGPILWMLKSSITPTLDTLRYPMALWPNGFDLSQFATAWNRVHIDRYLVNTLVIAFGSWAVQIVVATTAGFALAVLRPRFARRAQRAWSSRPCSCRRSCCSCRST